MNDQLDLTSLMAEIAAKDAEISRLREALQMISAESKEPNHVMGRSVFKALSTCGEIADLALSKEG